MTLSARLQRLIPTREQLQAGRFTRWLAPWLGQRRLWRLSRHGVALGISIGIFFGLLIPIAQIPASAAVAIVLRANLPAAMGSTLVTNPLTFGPIYYLTYQAGSRIVGKPVPNAEAEIARITEALEAEERATGEPPSPWQRLQALGKPLIVGLAVFAVICGLLTYALVSGGWWLWARWRRRRRRLQPS